MDHKMGDGIRRRGVVTKAVCPCGGDLSSNEAMPVEISPLIIVWPYQWMSPKPGRLLLLIRCWIVSNSQK